jgi:hypothetical protein
LHARSFEDVCAIIDPDKVWADASSALQIKFAIQIACRKKMMSMGNYAGFSKLPEFYIGQEFFPSLKAWQADGRHRFATLTLEMCAAAVLDIPTIEIKAFRKAKRAFDLASPVRAHVSGTGVGLRLMMWERPGAIRCIEFANVGGKSEEEISYSDPSTSV